MHNVGKMKVFIGLCLLVGISGIPHHSRIVNGEVAVAGEFPFVVEVKLNGYFRCGGFIYNANYIVTSAICVSGYPTSNFQVTVGQYNTNAPDPGEQTLAVSSITIHEGFQLSTYRHNIALIRVLSPVTFNQYVDSIQLGPVDLSLDGTLMGWGSQTSNGVTSTTLMKKTITMSTLAGCSSYGAEFDPNTMICAGQGSDACTGDAGSPLIQANSAPIGTSTTASSTSAGPSTVTSTVSSEPTTLSTHTTPCSTTPVTQSTEPAGTTASVSPSSTAAVTDPPPFGDVTDECNPTPSVQENTTEPLPRSFGRMLDTPVAIGIVSHNRVCGNPAYPTVFTNLAMYRDWLAANAGPQV